MPWTTFQPHAHWARVVWLPFSTPPPIAALDIVVNVLLYLPFGFLYARSRSRPTQVFLWGTLWAAALSASTESTQVFSHGRFPSATDVTLNVVGALAGIVVWRHRSHRFSA